MSARRRRDARGRFIATPKPKPPLSAQQLGDLTAWTVPDEREPQNILETRTEWRIHHSWWQVPLPPRT